MTQEHDKLQRIFDAALELSGSEREIYLGRACGDDAQLRQRVEKLLRALDRAGGFLARPERVAPAGGSVTVAPGTVLLQVTEKPGDRIGRYKLLQEIGEGGCGVVYMAEQENPIRRRVALKVIKLGMDTKQVIARFEAERQALALMDHPNIAKVLDAGATETGRPYFVMELVRGTRITDYCDQNNLSTRERLGLFTQVCHAIQHAHQKGLIHRDIKPSNILVSLHDDVPVPKVIDFGIAKAMGERLTDKTFYTQFEQFMGTPAYMSPEQAGRSDLDIDTRSDIYSLGVLLYELLAGLPPLDPKQLAAAGLEEMVRCIREEEPLRPSMRLSRLQQQELTTTAQRRGTEPPKLIHLLRGDLDWIVMKCLEKNRTRRYGTADTLALDIERHLNNEPVAARPPSAAYKVHKFVRRNKVMVAAAGVIALVLVLGALVSASQAVRATRAHRLADSARDQARHNLYIANLNLAQTDYEQGNVGRLHELLEATRAEPGRGFEWYYWQRELHRTQTTFRGHLDRVMGVAISPDGETVATASADGSAKLWDTTGRVLRTFPFEQGCGSVDFSPEGERFAIATGAQVAIWDLRQHRELLAITNTYRAPVRMAVFSPDGRKIAAALWAAPGVAGTLADASTGKLLTEYGDGTTNRVLFVGFSRDGQRVLTSDYEGIARIWDTESGRLLRRFEGRGGSIWAGDFSPDGQRVVTAHDAAFVAKVWDVATTKVVHTLRGHRNFVVAVAFSPDGGRIYTTGLDQQIKVWDAATGQELPSMAKSQSSSILRMAVAKDGRHILTGSWNGEANWWPVETGGPRTIPVKLWPQDDYSIPARWDGYAHGPIVGLVGDAEHGTVAAAGPDFGVRVRDLGSEQDLFVLRGHTNAVSCLCFSPDLRLIATASFDQTARLWDARRGVELFALTGHTGRVTSVSFSPDGRQVLTTSGQAAKVWDCPSGRARRQLDHGADVKTAAFSPDSRHIAVAGENGVTLWDAESGTQLHRLEHRDGGIYAVAWTSDSQRLATGGWASLARLWDVSNGRQLREFKGHRHWIFSLAFSPDGQRLLTGGQDHTAKLWEVATGRELLTLAEHQDTVISVQFSADGQRIVTSSDDQTVKIWQSASPKEVAAWEQEEKAAGETLEQLRRERDRAKAQKTSARPEGNQ